MDKHNENREKHRLMENMQSIRTPLHFINNNIRTVVSSKRKQVEGYGEILNHCFSVRLCSLQVEPLIIFMRVSRLNLTVSRGGSDVH